MNNITFVSCILKLYMEEYDLVNKTIEKRIENFELVAKSNINIYLYTDDSYYDKIIYLENKYPNVKIINIKNIYNTELGKILLDYEKEIEKNINIPKNRNIKKDTREFLLLMNLKMEFIFKIITLESNKKSKYYYWFDFSIGYIFKKKEESINKMLEILNLNLLDEFLYIPGCWDTKFDNDEYLIDNIVWRFCGGIIIGDSNSLINFYELCKNNYKIFFLNFNTLVWETNYWSWIEKEKNFFIHWNYSAHDDNIVVVPNCIIKQ